MVLKPHFPLFYLANKEMVLSLYSLFALFHFVFLGGLNGKFCITIKVIFKLKVQPDAEPN